MAKTAEETALCIKLLDDFLAGEPPTVVPVPEPPAKEETVEEEDSSDEEPPPIIRDPEVLEKIAAIRAEQRQEQAKKQQARHAQMQQAMGFAVNADDSTPFAFGATKGQPAPVGVKFVPFGAVARYCYNSVPPQWLQPLASAFFDSDQIYNRPWDFYYAPPSAYSDALPFVTEDQLQALICEINVHFPTAKIAARQDIIIDFEDLPDQLRPRRAGHVASRSQYNSLVFQISREPDMVLPDGQDRSLAAFKEKMQVATDAHRAKGKRAKAAKKEQFMASRQGMVKESLSAQRYLGLLDEKEDLLLPDISNLSISPLDIDKPAPHPFDQDPIFIAIDVEAYEKPPRMVTEVGIATLDTRDLHNRPPGVNGSNWHQRIRARHFRISEYKSYVNHEYVQGCPGNFEFGESEFVSKNTTPAAIASCFRPPFSQPAGHSEGEETPSDAPLSHPEKRTIILVGHDVSQDIAYCRDIGFNLSNNQNIHATIDTANLYRTFTKDPSARSLGAIINDFDMTGWHLHNAGNDAVYTLHAMLAICIKMAENRGNPEAAKELQEKIEKRVEAKVEDARERAQADAEGWEELDGNDGGVPLKPAGDSHFRFYTIGGAVLDV